MQFRNFPLHILSAASHHQIREAQHIRLLQHKHVIAAEAFNVMDLYKNTGLLIIFQSIAPFDDFHLGGSNVHLLIHHQIQCGGGITHTDVTDLAQNIALFFR